MIASLIVSALLGPLDTETLDSQNAICGLGLLPDGTITHSV
jgi:hypothetical protein